MKNLIQKLIDKLNISLCEDTILETVDGVKVCAIGGVEKNLSYLACTLDALDLIEQNSPRHYKRIHEHLDYIVDTELLSAGSYEHASHACKIDFTRMYHPLDSEWMCWYFAGILVHEATHGLISDKGISYTPEARVQIERICRTEENRFLKNAPNYLRDDLICPFREIHWTRHWEMPRGQYLWELIQRQLAGKEFTSY